MMAKKYLRTEEIVKEIQRLESSEYVALARTSEEVEVALQQYLAELQRLEEKGMALDAAGISRCQLEAMADCMLGD